MSDGTEVIKSSMTPVIPAEAQGFGVEVGIGPYPPDKPRSRQRAVYAVLTPVSAHARALMASKNRERVLGMVPLTPAGAQAITADPGGQLAERTGTLALREALRLVRD